MPETARMRRRSWLAPLAAGLVCGLLAFAFASAAQVVAATPAHAAEEDSSAVTITAAEQDPDLENAPMPDLAVTISQTQNLVAQGIRITWTGGLKSIAPDSSSGGRNFLQIFMCWGDDPEDPGRPDRTTCMYGGANTPGATRDAYRNITIDQIPEEDQQYSARSAISFLPPYTGIPFVARDGSRIDGVATDPNTGARTIDTSVNLNINQFFTAYSTNEVPWIGSGDDGNGSVSFEVQTASQAPSLGCGSAVTEGAVTKGASCWLVVLPRGVGDNGSSSITQSGLFIDSWRHALVAKLSFEPIGSRCPEGAAERQLAGSELAAFAVNSWQPVVCNQDDASVYSLLTIPETDAVTAAATTDGAPLALTSYPLRTDGGDPLAYAPIALTAVSISVAIDRRPDPFKEVPEQYLDAARTPFPSINLTPRLIAKLLSYSYRSALPPGADTSEVNAENPYNITKDPDFLAVNDAEWAMQDLAGAAIADIIVPQGRLDAARAVWAYIAADKDAADFLAGDPDPWGMTVNPWYSTNAETNPSGVAFSLDRDDFPKADPVEATPPNAGPINLVTWRPYANDLASVSYLTLRGDAQTPGGWNPDSVPPKYNKAARMVPGSQALLGMTSASAASRYQIVTASLRNPAGAFVAPTDAGMLAAASAMSALSTNSPVLGFVGGTDDARGATAAYPLTMPVYAAANPAMTDADLRGAYAAFIRYAVSAEGQTPGVGLGQLPVGYAPLPENWAATALAAAEVIESGPAPTPAPTPAGSTAYIPTQTATSSAGSATAPVTETPTSPSATGVSTGALSGGTTPADPSVGGVAAAVPLSAAAGVAGAVAVPLISRLRRRVT